MKKIIFTLTSIVLIITIMLTSCSSSKKYEIYEAEQPLGAGNTGAAHQVEVEFESKTYKKNLKRNKKIRINGSEYDMEYQYSYKTYYHNSGGDLYVFTKDDLRVQARINDAGEITFFSFDDLNYIVEKEDTPQKTREECLEVVKTYFANYVDDVSEYQLVRENYVNPSEWNNGSYSFFFTRFIDGIETFEKAIFGVTTYGDVHSHSFTGRESMKNAKLPSEQDMQTIHSNIDKKIQTIYSNTSEKYTYTYELKSPIFYRLANGKYALAYSVTVLLQSKSDPNANPIRDYTRLFVYV